MEGKKEGDSSVSVNYNSNTTLFFHVEGYMDKHCTFHYHDLQLSNMEK